MEEKQRSSGVWISTTAGSSGAIYSAGGKIMGPSNKGFQYLVRELYVKKGEKYKLKTGILKKNEKIVFKSLMRNGRIYIDGSHSSIPFPFGAKATVTISPSPVKTVA
jgi:NAD+ kinase